MLIHPWDAAQNDEEWRAWIARSPKFGVLGIPNPEPGNAPMMIPSHFTLRDDHIVMHLARPNEAISWLHTASTVSFMVTGDYAFIDNQWRAKSTVPAEEGVPTSYYVAIEFICEPTVISDPDGIAQILREQMADMQPDGGYAEISTGEEPYGAMLKGIRAISLKILSVDAKFKFDDHKPTEMRRHVATNLENRATHLDVKAATTQRSRLASMGEWKAV